jgi:hypothetical protein
MKRSIKFLAAILTAIMVFSILPSMALAESGTCGDNVTWTLGDDGTLTISGTGDMEDYTDSITPWYGNSSSIKSVVVENGVTNIGNCAFNGCESLTSVTIPDSVTSIGEGAFENCTSLTSVTIPDSVTSIGDGAFSHCRTLEKIEIDVNNNNYASIDGVLFDKEKSKLIAYPNSHGTTYEIPNSVASIENHAFYLCSNLESITIPDSVTSIGENVFFNCYKLTSVTIPNSVTSIGDWAFSACTSLEKIEVDSKNNNYASSDGVLFDKGKTTLIRYPEGKTNKKYEIPNSVTRIEHSAFENCESLKRVAIPDSVTSIGESTFEWCDNLTDIYYAGSEDEWNSISIESDNDYLKNATIHYNADSKSSGWIWNTVTDFLISICQKIAGFFHEIIYAF